MADAANYRAAEERPLTTEERTLLEWLIAHGTPAASGYSSQLPHVSVVGRCTCGCPSVDLAVDGRSASLGAPSEIIADMEGRSPEGIPVGVILHCREGLLSELEVYPFSDVEGRFTLPESTALSPLTG